MFFLNWKVKYYLFQFLENMILALEVASLRKNRVLTAADIRSSSIIAESRSKTSLDKKEFL